MTRILSVIPARAGSKGIVGKNFKEFAGKPLVEWSVWQSLSCLYAGSWESDYADAETVARTVVSSNCPYVKEVVDSIPHSHQVVYIPRPESLCEDLSPSEEALIHSYEWMRDHEGYDADVIIMLQPTSPIRRPSLLKECVETFRREKERFGCDSLVSVQKITPFFMRKEPNGDSYIPQGSMIIERPMRQSVMDFQFFYHDCGNVYITDIDILIETNNRVGKKPTMFVVSDEEALQIDTELDFRIAEEIMRKGYS